jgi:multicomponent Na+:H+ antiporter subunit D
VDPVLLPLLIPLLFVILTMLAWNRTRWQRILSLVGSAALLLAGVALLAQVSQSGIRSTQIGNWPAPFGITLVADLFSAIMLAITGLVGLTTAMYALDGIDERRVAHGFYPLFFALLMGVCGAFLTGDIFNLYVWFEVMLMASFVLMALGGERAQLEGAIKYVILNLTASALFLSATGILYSLTGTLNMADLSLRLREISSPEIVTTIAMLYMVAFGIKAAIFPLFFWLPASYHTPPVAVTALFSGLLTKVGVYSLVRVFTLLFLSDVAFTHTILLVLGGLTMVVGVLGAAAQYDMRRLLSFHIVSQIGYLLMGLGLYTQAGLASTVFFMAHVIAAKSALFLVAGIIRRVSGSFDLRRIGGLYRHQPWLALLFLIPALSLAGLPPLSGFFGKLALVRAGLEQGQYVMVAVSLAVSLLTLFSMIKIWMEAFWKPAPAQAPPQRRSEGFRPSLVLPALALGLVSILLGAGAQAGYGLAERAAAMLFDPAIYIAAVLGGGR